MYNFNFNVLDPYIVRPVAVAWRDYVPQPARNGLSNFTGNLEEPAVMVNYFLQGDPYQGMVHFTRFFLNTILGMGGFIDVAGMANPYCNGLNLTASVVRLVIMAWVMGLTFSYRSTVASRCVMTVVIWRMASPSLWRMSVGKWTLEGIETRAAAGFRWSAASVVRSLYYGARSVLPAS